MLKNVFITGGAGYVGSKLVPSLLEKGYNLKSYDLNIYGDALPEHPNLKKIRADIRDKERLKKEIVESDAVIHLACISNDPSFDLNPNLGKSINYEAFFNILDAAKINKIERLIYASSSSVYGVKDVLDITEDADPDPITDYSKYKLACERVLKEQADGLPWTIVRPATVCGYASRLRLDLVGNILTINALEKGKIKVFGGNQLRPNININDMVRVYESLLEAPDSLVVGQTFNAGHENYSVEEIAKKVQSVIKNAELEYVSTDDNRSYHINSDKIRKVLGFKSTHTIEDAVESLVRAYKDGKIIDGLNNPLYHNIKRMKELQIN